MSAPYDLTRAEHDYPPYEGLPMRSVLIATHPRSGSTLLGEALYFAGGLGCPIEYFHRGFRPGLAERWGTESLAGHVAAVHRRRTDPTGTLGIKLFWQDMEVMAAELDPERFAGLPGSRPEATTPEDYRAIASLLASVFPDPRFVHLERTDRVRAAVSGLTAVQTGRFRVIPEMGAQPAKAAPEYDFDRIDGLIGQSDSSHRHWRAYFAATGVQPLTLTYEQLAADYAGSVRRVLDGLGSDAPVPPVRMRRQSDTGNESFVLRYLRERAAIGS